MQLLKKCKWLIPNINDILTYLEHDTKWFSTLDLKNEYWQVAMKKDCKEYTSFIAQGQGQCQFKVMPFGLCNAPSTFQALMDKLCADINWKVVLVISITRRWTTTLFLEL